MVQRVGSGDPGHRPHAENVDCDGAVLTDADLTGADLTRADLTRAVLRGAVLTGAKWRDDIILQRAPLQVHGLPYVVTILDDHMQIGCELHRIDEWADFGDEQIARMDGANARRFWSAHRDHLLALARADGRGVRKLEAAQ